MSNKLQELTDKLYNEGLNKGREEGDRLLSEARENARQTVEKAKADASEIIAQAKKEAEELKSKAYSDVKMASEQALQATKKDIENILLGKIASENVSKALADTSFLKETIKAVAQNFSATESKDLALILPESLKNELEPWIGSELTKVINAGVKADFSKKISGGFTIGPADGSWFISLTDETFRELVCEYMRPATRKLLFGE